MAKLPSYRVDFARLFPNLLPMLLRRGRRLNAWLSALLSPLTEALYPDFLRLMAQARRELTHNGQTIVLESALNVSFDPNPRRIEVCNDDTEVLPQALFYKAEGQALPELFYRSELPYVSSLELTYQVESGGLHGVRAEHAGARPEDSRAGDALQAGPDGLPGAVLGGPRRGRGGRHERGMESNSPGFLGEAGAT